MEDFEGRDFLAKKLLEITERHNGYLEADTSLGLDKRRSRTDRVRVFYTTILRNLGMNSAEQEAHKLFSSRERIVVDRADKNYALHEVLKTLGVKDNTQIFGILERSSADIQRVKSEEAIEFYIPGRDLQKIVGYLKSRGVFQDGNLR